MIYVQENGLKRQLELLAFLSQEEACELVVWLYPESRLKHFSGLLVLNGQDGLKPVTTYTDGTQAKSTSAFPAASNSIVALKPFISKFKRNCDSIALYPAGKKDWSVCTIGHEGMCLVKNDKLLSKIQTAGFVASLAAPVWW